MSFGGPALLDDVTVVLEPGQRACIVGRNGAGKSTLLKIAAGTLQPDHGDVQYSTGSRAAFLTQEIPDSLHGTVQEFVASACLHDEIPEWELNTRVERIIADMGLIPDADCDSLSAGTKRRVLLARELVWEPDVLLLDEPTNHLDIAAIAWLEKFLNNYKGALLFITHDRAFLQNVASEILDLDRGRITRWVCDYNSYILRKEEWLVAEARNQAVFDKKLAQEEAWIRQGIQARRTRNEGRVRALKRMREEHRARRQRTGAANMQIEEAGRSGVKVISAKDISYAWDSRPIVKNFSDIVERGDRIGIVGPNGCGKSTLVKLLLGKLAPQRGELTHGTGLEIAYYDQTREQLVETQTVQEAIANGLEVVEINGGRKHVMTYLQDFLFTPDRARSTIDMLSGGERNRLMLARLFARPFNLLVMDEPTNDLDLETLELLEELLSAYTGTLLLVSHDRAFIDNVVTDLLVLDGSGNIESYVGGYSDYLDEKAQQAAARERAAKAANKSSSGAKPEKARKFLNRERWELEALPAQIEELEKESAEIAAKLAAPKTYTDNPTQVPVLQARSAEIDNEMNAKFARWEELEALRVELEG
ncbi:MAG: ATP-binding cassette domain-containing protein [Opitutales bacterium]|nr:ATP-binding cassette domain-containing protein [Opitutales bacterium]